MLYISVYYIQSNVLRFFQLVWWLTPAISTLERLMQKACQEFKANLVYIVSYRSALAIE